MDEGRAVRVKDLFDIPEHVRKTDFVVKLSEGVDRAEETAATYVVTSAIRDAIDGALGLVKTGLDSGRSHAAYIQGSFGSGKSHFMAMVSLLLENNDAAWRVPQLHALRDKHAWVKAKNVLQLRFHIGSTSSHLRPNRRARRLDLVPNRGLTRKDSPRTPVPVSRISTGRLQAGGRFRASTPREVKDRLARLHAPPPSPLRRGDRRRDGATSKSSCSEPNPTLVRSKTPHPILVTTTLPGDLGKAVEKLKGESGGGLFVGGVKLPLALAELGLIDEYEFVVQPVLAGHAPTLFAGLSKRVDLKLVSRLEFGSGAVAMRYEPRPSAIEVASGAGQVPSIARLTRP